MKSFRCTTALCAALLAFAGGAGADDGALQIQNVSKTPDWDTEHASLQQLWFYVPAQASNGDPAIITYEPALDGVEPFDREFARPLIAFYEDGPVVIPEDSGGFYGHGERDMYGAVSLDDGATWKRANLSESADRYSIRVDRKKYPGDVFRNFTAAAGNKLLAVWASRYCDGGNPSYAMESADIEAIFTAAGETEPAVDASHLGDVVACTDGDADMTGPDDDEPTQCLYFEDYWHVAGSQGIKDFAEEGYPSVGKVPYGCLWAARGTLEYLADDGVYDIVWRKAERLTSGVRDVHRMEAACVGGAGCVITWQEDPEGLRPGEGEGPGEGWSGAIGHHETDIWYSYLDWDNFDAVMDGDDIIPFDLYLDDKKPQAAVPFSIPVRLSDNAKCQEPLNAEEPPDDPYCYMDFDASGTADYCATTVDYAIETPEGPTQTVAMCVAEDGRLLRGNTASTRTRTNLRGYESAADTKSGTNSGWVVLAYEESKGLGEEEDEDPDKIDMGKNIWYHTFDMFNPELVSQGMILNQPAIYPRDVDVETTFNLTDGTTLNLVPVDATAFTDYEAGGDFMIVDPDPIYSVAGLESTLYQTEIARRYSQITQPASWAGGSGTVALAMYKQGVVRRGGPADVFGRRFVMSGGFNAGIDNPFDYTNMVCADRIFTDGSNPRYLKGLCLDSPQNLSGTSIVACEDGLETCEPELFPYDDRLADIDKSDQPGGLPKMTEWRMCQSDVQTFSVASSGEVTSFGCDDNDLNDQSWENPWDLSKGHRGFMYGDFIMMMYAWSPNWEANTLAHDNYNLYVRRSFNGGESWTTYPGSVSLPVGAVIPDGVTADGSLSCEWYGVPGGDTEFPACFTYGPGEFEQARNLSQLVGTQSTVLDPRYTGTDPSFLGNITKWMVDGELVGGWTQYPDDLVDPSKFFATFEEGDTAEIAEGGEGMPMDMFYARAVNFGDEYELADVNEDGIADPDPTDGEFETFDKLEWHEGHAAEAALKTNPGGTLFYAIWNEWMETADGHVYDSDAIVRRTMELDDDGVTTPSGGSGDGGEPPVDPPGNSGNAPGKNK